MVEGLIVQSIWTRFSSTRPSQSSSIQLQISALGAPGTHSWGTPPRQLSTVRRHAPTPQVVWAGWCAHPVAGSQLSAVQTLPSSQEIWLWVQPPDTEQASAVQALPSSQLIGTCAPQVPVAGSQRSWVQLLLSLQSGWPPALGRHVPAKQKSSWHTFPSHSATPLWTKLTQPPLEDELA